MFSKIIKNLDSKTLTFFLQIYSNIFKYLNIFRYLNKIRIFSWWANNILYSIRSIFIRRIIFNIQFVPTLQFTTAHLNMNHTPLKSLKKYWQKIIYFDLSAKSYLNISKQCKTITNIEYEIVKISNNQIFNMN